MKTKRLLAIWIIQICVGTVCIAGENGILSWGQMLDKVKADETLAVARQKFIAGAEPIASSEIVRRVYKLEDVGGKGRSGLDGRSKYLEDEIRQTFALAMSDFFANNTVSQELPVLAGAYRLTGDEKFRKRVIAQLEEMSSWSPLQRPGWTCYTAGHRLPADGKDGNWLATGVGVRAIADTLEIMPAGSIDPALVEKLDSLLLREIADIVEDWQVKRPWFVSGNNPITNQWVLPTEGLVRACLVTGVEANRPAYELGVKNMLMAMDAHGEQGEFEEGANYAGFTVTSMLHTARALALTGDRRLLEHPYLSRFPLWYLHHLQPGDMGINCFDCGWCQGAREHMRPLLTLVAICVGDKTSRWALKNLMTSDGTGLYGLLANNLDAAGIEQPPLFAAYDRARRVNWRSSWELEAAGVWIRGGHKLDQHDHQDRGHVNFIHHGRAILIEAGTPSYDHPRFSTHMASGAGHNVLQLGAASPEGLQVPIGGIPTLPGWQKESAIAPITVNRLDRDGGEVVVDGTAGYDHLDLWRRNVNWSSDQIKVADEMVLAKGHDDVVLFRWHLGTHQPVQLGGEGKSWRIEWPDARIKLIASAPIHVDQQLMPDNTLPGHTGEDKPENSHTCLIVRSSDAVAGMTLATEVEPR
jgi:hypothetical protein